MKRLEILKNLVQGAPVERTLCLPIRSLQPNKHLSSTPCLPSVLIYLMRRVWKAVFSCCGQSLILDLRQGQEV